MSTKAKRKREPRVHVAHFSIRGEDLTRLARDTMLSDKPNAAYQMLVRGLRDPQNTIEHYAPKILDGDMTLTGDEHGMGLGDDNDIAYKNTLHYVFAGRVRINNAWWRPSARVVMFGPDDAKFALSRDPDRDKSVEMLGEDEYRRRLHKFAKDRVAFYASRGEQVVEVDGSLIIFEAIGEPPFWWSEHPSVEAALADFESVGRTLQEYSHEPERQRNAYADELLDEARAFEEIGDVNRADKLRARARIREEFERDAGLEDAADDQERQRVEAIVNLRTKILEQADGDMLHLRSDDGNGDIIATVARAPFLNWALGRAEGLKHLAPPWQCVSPTGMKLALDDPYHTDWWLSGGFDISKAYEQSPAKEASERMMYELQRQLGGFECAVLVDGPDVYGIVGKDIAVVPDLEPNRIDALVNARACVTEVGGKLAHLAQVALERSIPMLRMHGALTKLLPGMRVTVSAETGSVRIHGGLK